MPSVPVRAACRLTLPLLALCGVLQAQVSPVGGISPRPVLGASAGLIEPLKLLDGDETPDLIVSPWRGAVVTQIIDADSGVTLGAGYPFGSTFAGGVSVAAGDLNDDGVTDVVLAMGLGGGEVTILDGLTAGPIASGHPFGTSFAGGISVAVGDVNGDGSNDIVIAQASGGGSVSVFDGQTYDRLFTAVPFGPLFSGGLHVACDDADNDGRADILVGQAAGGAVALVDGASGRVAQTATAFASADGVFVAMGDVNGDGAAELMAAPGGGGGPVLVYDLQAAAVIAAFTPYGLSAGGVHIVASDITGDGRADIVTAPGREAASGIHVYDGVTFTRERSFDVASRGFSDGVLVAVAKQSRLRFASPSTATFEAGRQGLATLRVTGGGGPVDIFARGHLPSGVTITARGARGAAMSGVPAAGAGGMYPLTLVAQGRRAATTQAFTLIVNEAPAVTSAATATFREGVAGAFTVTSTGFPTPVIRVVGTLPPGLALTPGGDGTATLRGTPSPGSRGAYVLRVTAENAAGASETQALAVDVTLHPAFTSAAATTFTAGVTGIFHITTSGAPRVTRVSLTGTLPAGVTFVDGGTGAATLAGRPATTSGGVYPLTLIATNDLDLPVVQAFTLSVHQAPSFTSAANATFTAGTAGMFRAVATGYPTPTVAVAGALPNGISATQGGDGSLVIAGTPAALTGGLQSLAFTASNGVGLTASQAFTMTVLEPSRFSSSQRTFNFQFGESYLITTSGYPLATIEAVSSTFPATLRANGDGTATLTAAAVFPVNTGAYLRASNGIGTPEVISISINTSCPVRFTPPGGELPTGAVGTPYSLTLGAAGPFSPYHYSVGGLPPGIAMTTSGSLAGTPTVAGRYQLTATAFSASNPASCFATVSYSLTVTP